MINRNEVERLWEMRDIEALTERATRMPSTKGP